MGELLIGGAFTAPDDLVVHVVDATGATRVMSWGDAKLLRGEWGQTLHPLPVPVTGATAAYPTLPVPGTCPICGRSS